MPGLSTYTTRAQMGQNEQDQIPLTRAKLNILQVPFRPLALQVRGGLQRVHAHGEELARERALRARRQRGEQARAREDLAQVAVAARDGRVVLVHDEAVLREEGGEQGRGTHFSESVKLVDFTRHSRVHDEAGSGAGGYSGQEGREIGGVTGSGEV